MAPKRMAMSLAELLKSPEAPSADHLEKWFTKDPKKTITTKPHKHETKQLGSDAGAAHVGPSVPHHWVGLNH